MEQGKWRLVLEGEYWDEYDKADLDRMLNEFVQGLEDYYVVQTKNIEYIPEQPETNDYSTAWHPV